MASHSGTNQTNTGHVFLPQTPETFNYDADGNLTNDGRWVFIWDGENRLVGLEPRAGVPDAAKLKFLFAYDDQGRRVSKVVSNWTGSAWAFMSERRFVHSVRISKSGRIGWCRDFWSSVEWIWRKLV